MEQHDRGILPPTKPTDPLWKRILVAPVNFLPIGVFFVFSFYMMYQYSGDVRLAAFRDLYMNTVIPSVIYGMGAFLAGIWVVGKLNPDFSPSKMMNSDNVWDRGFCVLYWCFCMIALAMVIKAGY